MTTLYADSIYPVRSDLDGVHARQVAAMGNAGTWGTGAQRLAVARAVREARRDAGVQEGDIAVPDAVAGQKLPAAIEDAIRTIAVSPKDLDRTTYETLLGSGVSDAEYVEMVGVVARVVDFDVLARGLGVPVRPLPAPVAGKPSRLRPQTAVDEGAWAPTVPAGRRGGADAKSIYGDLLAPFIIRALSLVPEEARLNLELEHVQDLPLEKFGQFDHRQHEGLSRPQVEVVAGRVSAYNDCFY